MRKKKTSKKQKFSFEDMPAVKSKKAARLSSHNPSRYFKNPQKVGLALLECLEDNDTESFIEILDAYLEINRSQIAKSAKLARSTVNEAMSGKKNPSLKTIAKIVHEARKVA